MSMAAIMRAAGSLFGVCAAAAGMEMLSQGGRLGTAFRSLCALAVAVMALRLVAGMLGA